MILGFNDLSLLTLCFGVVVAGPALAADGRGSKRANAKAVQQQIKLKEIDALRSAYVLLASANHDYDGQRVKAMGHLEKAAKLLESGVMKNGTAAQQTIVLNENSAAARAKIIARYVKTVHEGQAQSDAQLRAAGQLLGQVRAVLVQRKQTRALGHVNDALKEIGIALRVR